MRIRFFFWPIAASLLSCPAVCAQNQRIALDYVADPTCPARSEFIAQVRARTPLADFTDDAAFERQFSVSVSRRKELFVGSLSSPSGYFSTTERQVSSENCLDVVSALALITALAIDLHADLTEAPMRAADDATPPPAASAISTASVPDSGEGSALEVGGAFVAPQSGRPMAPGQVGSRRPGVFERTLSTTPAPVAADRHVAQRDPGRVSAWLLGAGVEGAFWPSSPGVLWGGLSLVLERQFLSRASLLPALRFNIAHSRSAAHRTGAGAARFTQNLAAVDACLVAVRWAAVTLHGCVGVEGGWIIATGLAEAPIVSTERHNRPWWALHQQAELIIGLSRNWATVLDVGLAEPLWRDHFVFDLPASASPSAAPIDLLRTPAWCTRVALRLGRRF